MISERTTALAPKLYRFVNTDPRSIFLGNCTFGIPTEQVIGSSIKANYEVRDGKPVLIKIPELAFIEDKSGKPVGIYQHIGRRPIFAVGNSDGDFEMLEWTTAGEGARLGLLIHHTDAKREYAYDRKSLYGKLEKGLDAAEAKGWIVTDRKADWKTVFPAAPPGTTK